MKILVISFESQLKNLINKLHALVGATFGNILYYENENGQIADYKVNFGMNYGKAKNDDFKTLSDAVPSAIADEIGRPLPLVLQAYGELIKSFNPNEKPSNQSIAQSEAYIHTDVKGMRILKADLSIHFYAYAEITQIHQAGEYKTVNSSLKTICKNEIKKALNLKTNKFRNFKVKGDKFFGAKIQGDMFII